MCVVSVCIGSSVLVMFVLTIVVVVVGMVMVVVSSIAVVYKCWVVLVA